MTKDTEGQATTPASVGVAAPVEKKAAARRPARAKSTTAKARNTTKALEGPEAQSPAAKEQATIKPAAPELPVAKQPADSPAKPAARARKSAPKATAKTDSKKNAPEAAGAGPAPAQVDTVPTVVGEASDSGKAKGGSRGRSKRSGSKTASGAKSAVDASEVKHARESEPETIPAEPKAVAQALPMADSEVDAVLPQAGEGQSGPRPAGSGRSRRSRARRARKQREAAQAGQDTQKDSPTPADEAAVAEGSDWSAEESQALTSPPFDWNTPQSDDPLTEAVEEDSGASDPAPQSSGRSRSRGGKKHKGRQDKESQDSKVQSKDAAADEDDEFADSLDIDETEARESGGKKVNRKMFVSVLPGEQVEVVFTEEGLVHEYYVEMLHQAKVKGNIYKGVVHNVDPNLQAAFVSYGAAKNGFLQIDEVHPEYYLTPHDAGKNRKYPLIQKVLKTGQEILVQVVKEPAGTKGAFLTSYLSMPGRFLVLTPGREQIGVSRKVESEEERARLREMLTGLTPGPGLGVIVRTVSMGAGKTHLQRDLQFLKRLWREVRKKGTTVPAPSLIYQELDLASRAVRDYLTEDVQEVWVDDDEVATQIRDIVGMLFPRKQNLVQVHKDPARTLFERFSLQNQINQVHSREVSLPSGGRLVFDHTEALTAIDINSGRSGGKTNFEDMAYRINMEAAQIIPLQLRLRDIGGQVVVDFIEMRDRSHWREVERAIRTAMKSDRARHDVGKIGPFGLLEIVRQRLGSSAISVSIEPCPCCKGTGIRRNMEWQSQQALREIHRLLRQAQTQNQTNAVYAAGAELVLHLLNSKRERLLDMEKQFGIKLELKPA